MTQDAKTFSHTVKVGDGYGNDHVQIVKAVGEVGELSRGALVPVQFEDGTYGVIWQSKELNSQLHSQNAEWNELLAKSDTMPTASRGIGSDVLHIVVKQGGKPVLLKFYFNEKAEYRNDSIHRE